MKRGMLGAGGLLLLCGLAGGCGSSKPPSLPGVVEEVPPEPPPPVVVDPIPSEGYELPPLQQSLETYELIIPQETLARFQKDPNLDEQPATLRIRGQRYDVKVRLRGGSSRLYPKKSWRVKLPDGVNLDGRDKINLVAEQADRTLMVEKLGFDLLYALGVPAPRATWVRVSINGQYQGVYLDIERVDKDFTRARGWADRDPSIYRCGMQDCEMKLYRQPWQGEWEKETNESEPNDDLLALLGVINHTPEHEFAAALERHLDVEGYLRSMVMDALISNDIVMDSGSYLIRDQVKERWTYVPWDLNNSAARWWPTYGLGMTPIVDRPVPVFGLYDARVQFFYDQRKGDSTLYRPSFSNLTTRVMMSPRLRERYVELLTEALYKIFTTDVIHERIDAMHALLQPYVAQDPYVRMDTEGRSDPDGYQKFLEAREYMHSYVAGRANYLRQQLPRLRVTPALSLVLGAFDPAQGWVELRNDGTTDVSTAGLVLTTDLRNSVGLPSNVPARTLAPGERWRLTAAELGLTFAPAGEVGLFDGRSVVGVKDALFYGPLPPGHYYERSPAGTWAGEREWREGGAQ
jgi:spore coat protein H